MVSLELVETQTTCNSSIHINVCNFFSVVQVYPHQRSVGVQTAETGSTEQDTHMEVTSCSNSCSYVYVSQPEESPVESEIDPLNDNTEDSVSMYNPSSDEDSSFDTSFRQYTR